MGVGVGGAFNGLGDTEDVFWDCGDRLVGLVGGRVRAPTSFAHEGQAVIHQPDAVVACLGARDLVLDVVCLVVALVGSYIVLLLRWCRGWRCGS